MAKPHKRTSKRDSEAIDFARVQRATANEFARGVWQLVRARRCRGQKFRREYPIPPYTVDFCCVELKLVIEVDGEQHFTEQGQRHDAERDRFLSKRGYRVLRIPGYDLLRDGGAVLRLIEDSIDKRAGGLSEETPSPPRGRGEPGLRWASFAPPWGRGEPGLSRSSIRDHRRSNC